MGIISIKRTCSGRFSARAARSSSSPSFTPACGTQFNLTGMPLSSAACKPACTAANSSRAVICRNTSGRRVSRLMFTLSSPAASKAGSCCASRMPLVVMVTLRMPGIFHAVRHTVAAAQVAQIGNGKAQIVDLAPGGIKHSRPPPGYSGRSCRRSFPLNGSRPVPCPCPPPCTYRRW